MARLVHLEKNEEDLEEDAANISASFTNSLGIMEIVWLALLSVGLLVIVALVYRKYWNRTHVQAPSATTWSDAESGDAGDFSSDRSSVVDVERSVDGDTSDVESLGTISLDDDGPAVHTSPAQPNFRGATRAAMGTVFTDKSAAQM